jgi:hypothetical protein
MPTDYPRPVEDHFLLQAVFHAYAMNVTNREAVYGDQAEPEFRVSTNELVRAALKGRYAVATMYVEREGPPTLWSEEHWTIPRNRVLHFTAALRFLASDDSDDVDFVDDLIDPARVLGMAEAWALRQGLFQ